MAEGPSIDELMDRIVEARKFYSQPPSQQFYIHENQVRALATSYKKEHLLFLGELEAHGWTIIYNAPSAQDLIWAYNYNAYLDELSETHPSTNQETDNQ